MKVVVEMDERDYNTMKKGFMVVGVVKGKPLDSVLDEIRAKIMSLDYDIEDVYFDYNDTTQIEIIHTVCREEVLQIIDKYKGEST